MNVEEIKELIEMMRKNQIGEIDLEQEGSRVRIIASQPVIAAAPAPAAGAAAPPPAAEAPPAAPEADETEGFVEIKSPMVGTFYRAPAPDAPPYVDVGTVVNQDSVLCIVEAMKLMNELKAEIRGKIVKLLVENGQPVEYDQPLFLVEPF